MCCSSLHRAFPGIDWMQSRSEDRIRVEDSIFDYFRRFHLNLFCSFVFSITKGAEAVQLAVRPARSHNKQGLEKKRCQLHASGKNPAFDRWKLRSLERDLLRQGDAGLKTPIYVSFRSAKKVLCLVEGMETKRKVQWVRWWSIAKDKLVGQELKAKKAFTQAWSLYAKLV